MLSDTSEQQLPTTEVKDKQMDLSGKKVKGYFAHISSFICITILTEWLYTDSKHPCPTDRSVKEHNVVPHL